MTSPALSIVVPVYRTPIQLLERFLRSALNQTLESIQIIAVNDASPDDCPLVLDRISATDHRLTVLHRAVNGRAGVARGDGLGLAKGEYVLFADADDLLRPDMGATLHRLAKQHDADIVTCGWSILSQDGNLLGRGYFRNRCLDLTSNRQRAAGYRQLNYALWNKIFRRELIVPLRFEQFEANVGEDVLFNIAAFCRSRVLVTTAYNGYEYTVHGTSATGRASKGLSYLTTLKESDERIQQTLSERDPTDIGKRYADYVSLNRFTTGCGWIAEHPDANERSQLWGYWRRHFLETVYPTVASRPLLARWYRSVTGLDNVKSVYRFTRTALRLSDPVAYADRLAARYAWWRLVGSKS